MRPAPERWRARLADARILLVFTPELCAGREPLPLLERLLPEVDLVQIRPKAPAGETGSRIAVDPPGEARASFSWTLRALELASALPDAPPILVNDRVDVALALFDRGCAGVHLGQDDLPVEAARALLGEAPLIGLSTHDAAQVVEGGERAVDYLGFGPAFATRTKGYARGLGPEACWIAAQASDLPLFPIGGIGIENAGELERVGRAAIGAGVLAAPDPVEAARTLRALLSAS